MSKKTNVFYDAEFTGLHRDTKLISVGLATEYGSTFYAEFNDYDRDNIDEWLKANVISNLIFPKLVDAEGRQHLRSEKFNPFNNSYSVQLYGNTETIKDELRKWLIRVKEVTGGCTIQIISDCYAYDWMLFNDLICPEGKAINLPEEISYIPIDLSTMFYAAGMDPDINREGFIDSNRMRSLLDMNMFMGSGGSTKHNSLWDAYVINECYCKLIKDYDIKVFEG